MYFSSLNSFYLIRYFFRRFLKLLSLTNFFINIASILFSGSWLDGSIFNRLV